MRTQSDMNEDLSERGLRYARDQFDAVLNDTEQYVREKPAQSLLYAFLAGLFKTRTTAAWMALLESVVPVVSRGTSLDLPGPR